MSEIAGHPFFRVYFSTFLGAAQL